MSTASRTPVAFVAARPPATICRISSSERMEAEYDRFYALVTAGYVAILPRIDLMLRTMAATVTRDAEKPGALMLYLSAAMNLDSTRPPGWMPKEAATMEAFVDALPSGRLPLSTRLRLSEQAWRIADLLS